jgi:hypothetical protein
MSRRAKERLLMKRKRVFAISAARNAKLNSPRVVTPVNPEEERPRPQLSSSAHVSSVVLDSVTCPITQALVVRPAVAEDGKIYEYDAIKRWVRDNHRSPVTNSPMGHKLVVSHDARSIVEAIIESGAVDDEAAAAWHRASARQKIMEALPGGIAGAAVHLERDLVLASPTEEGDALRVVLALKDEQKDVLQSAAAAGVGHEAEKVILGRTTGAMTNFRDDLKPLRAIVRVIDDKAELTRLCKRPAPGADRAVKFDKDDIVDDMLAYCGREAIVRRTSKSRRAYHLWMKREGAWYAHYFPFDACIHVDEDGAPSDDDILSPDDSDSDDSSDSDRD